MTVLLMLLRLLFILIILIITSSPHPTPPLPAASPLEAAVYGEVGPLHDELAHGQVTIR
jgi:hypothetical protein